MDLQIGIVTEVELLDHMLTSGHTHDPSETIEALIRRDVKGLPVGSGIIK